MFQNSDTVEFLKSHVRPSIEGYCGKTDIFQTFQKILLNLPVEFNNTTNDKWFNLFFYMMTVSRDIYPGWLISKDTRKHDSTAHTQVA